MKLLLLLLFSIPALSFAQDLVVKKDSSNIYCKIIREEYDRIWVTCKDRQTGNDIRKAIPRSEILKYKKATDVKKIMNSKDAVNLNPKRASRRHRRYERHYEIRRAIDMLLFVLHFGL